MRIARLPLLALLTFLPTTGRSEMLLLADRVEVEQKTDVRFDAPEGCVITGIGFHAHQDAITTMHLRYHRLTPDGRLADPRVVRLGSEPEHVCDAEVYLPDGFVMVGFGARGAPEREVSTLRVWGRPLGDRGTMGPVQAFQAGKESDQGLERWVLLNEADRVITSAGLRMGSSDVTGIYARSRRVFVTDRDTKSRLAGMKARGWMVSGVTPEFLGGVLARAPEFGINFVMVSLPGQEGGRTIPDATAEREPLAAMARRCAGRNVDCYVWVRDPDLAPRAPGESAGAVPAETLESIPEIRGYVVGLRAHGVGTREEEESALQNLQLLAQMCAQHGRNLVVRAAAGSRQEIEDVARVGRSLASAIVMVPAVVGEWDPYAPDNPLLSMFPDQKVIVELDLGEQNSGRCLVPYAHPGDLQARLLFAGLAGAEGVVTRIGGSRLSTLGTLNEFNLFCLARLTENPLQPLDPLWTRYYTSRFGESAGPVISAMRRTRSAVDLIYHVDRFQFLSDGSRLAGIARAGERLLEGLDRWYLQLEEAKKELLDPTEKTLRRAAEEKETALWLVEQCRADIGSVSAALPAGQGAKLERGFMLLEETARLWQEWTRVYLLTQMYTRDASPRTLDALQAAVQELTGRFQTVQNRIDEPFTVGNLTDVLAEVRERIRLTRNSHPILAALQSAEELEGEGKHDEAAEALYDLMNEERYRAYLGEHDERLGAITSNLSAFGGGRPAGLQVKRGGDGAWTIERKEGRWCWAATPEGAVIYFDVPGEPMEQPRDFLLTFEYFDEGEKELSVHYNSDDGDSEESHYHPTRPIEITGTGTWKEGSLLLDKALFRNSQNLLADLRFIQSGEVMRIRNVKIAPK